MDWRIAVVLGIFACDGAASGDGTGDGGTTSPTEVAGGGGEGGGSNPSEFLEDFNAAICDLYFECWGSTTLDGVGWATVEDCYAAMTEGTTADTDDCPDFDASAAADCVDAMEALSCTDLQELTGSGELPVECSEEALCGT
jgi:hypothetical protein